MSYSLEIRYALMQMGVETCAEAGLAQLRINAEAAGAPQARLRDIDRFTAFIAAWRSFAGVQDHFTDVKKSYRQQALRYHPDRNQGSKHSEEKFKKINSAFALIEEIRDEAEKFVKHNAEIRQQIAADARAATEAEAAKANRSESKDGADAHAGWRRHHAETVKRQSKVRIFIAAAIPRPIRVARLGYLPTHTIIGSTLNGATGGGNDVMDIVMLPEQEFLRARSYLAVPSMTAINYQYGRSDQPYVPKHVRMITVPKHEKAPEDFARSYFVTLFGLI